MRSGMSAAALALALVVVGLVLSSSVDAVRTHELFAQSTYDNGLTAEPTTVSGEKAAVAEPLENVDNKHSEKTGITTPTSTTAQSTLSEPQQGQVNTDPSVAQDPESAGAQSSATFVNIPYEQQQQQTYRGKTPIQGDFKPDARPWWFKPTYGNYVQGRNPQLDAQEPFPTLPAGDFNLDSKFTPARVPNMETRYPLGYQNAYMDRRYPQNYYPSNGAYTATSQQQQQQYPETGFPQYDGNVPNPVPYQTSGGCPTQFWISNTQRWPAFFTVKTTVGEALGAPARNVFGETTLLQALLNTRPDGYSTLLRSACTAILNSYTRSQYEFSHVVVIESFAKALSSSTAAAEQAAAFEEANVSAYKDQYNSCF